jgi:hypothetical protein
MRGEREESERVRDGEKGRTRDGKISGRGGAA